MNEVLSSLAKLVRDPGVQIDMTGFIFALMVSALVGWVVSAMYQVFYENRATGSQIHRSFLLMSPSITALFVAIQFSLPLSLGLLGALSIVRFRTPVKEPEEVGFLMLLIASAVVCATFQFVLLFVLLALALVVLTMQKYAPGLLKSKRKDGLVLLTLKNGALNDVPESLLAVLGERFPRGKLESISCAEDLTTIHYSFTGRPQEGLHGLRSSLNDVAPIERFNIFFNGQGTIT